MNSAPYVDTSALAKWYLNETGWQAFDKFAVAQEALWISRLGTVELRSLLERRQQMGSIDARRQRQILRLFHRDVVDGNIVIHPLEDRQAIAAERLVALHGKSGLRTLDALHLAIAVDIGATGFATAGRVQAEVASAIGLAIHSF